jgi:hypothetical protein
MVNRPRFPRGLSSSCFWPIASNGEGQQAVLNGQLRLDDENLIASVRLLRCPRLAGGET